MNEKMNNQKMAGHNKHRDAELERSRDFIDLLTKRGFLEDTDINDEKIRKAVKDKKRLMYHNTTLMLKRYRDITWMLECFPSNLAVELEQPMYVEFRRI